jgi:16S rRNA (guanine527-N7)-methyltransferase
MEYDAACSIYLRCMLEETAAGVSALARQWMLPLEEERARRLALYLGELLRWNQRLNLTGARGARELIGEHLPDSFALSRLCPEGADVVDVGSGGGLPAIPFAILRPDCRVTLVEPRAKRVAFLNTAVRSCECRSVAVLRCRGEELPARSFSLATSRATFRPLVWLELAPSLLGPGGRAIVLAAGPLAAPPSAGKLVDSFEYRTESGAPRWSGSYCFT